MSPRPPSLDLRPSIAPPLLIAVIAAAVGLAPILAFGANLDAARLASRFTDWIVLPVFLLAWSTPRRAEGEQQRWYLSRNTADLCFVAAYFVHVAYFTVKTLGFGLAIPATTLVLGPAYILLSLAFGASAFGEVRRRLSDRFAERARTVIGAIFLGLFSIDYGLRIGDQPVVAAIGLALIVAAIVNRVRRLGMTQ